MNKADEFRQMKTAMTKDAALSRIYGAVKVVSDKQQILELTVDGMTAKTQTAVTKELRKEGFSVETTKDKDVKNRIWYKLDWSN